MSHEQQLPDELRERLGELQDVLMNKHVDTVNLLETLVELSYIRGVEHGFDKCKKLLDENGIIYPPDLLKAN